MQLDAGHLVVLAALAVISAALVAVLVHAAKSAARRRPHEPLYPPYLGPQPSPVAQRRRDIEDRLQDLVSMRRQNLISPAEYQQARAEALRG